jgi:hypothetical protein
VKLAIDLVMLRKPKDLGVLKEELRKQAIAVVTRQNAKGDIYGITYVDHRNKTVFNGSDIGKDYSAKGLLEKLNAQEQKMSAIESQKMEANFYITD